MRSTTQQGIRYKVWVFLVSILADYWRGNFHKHYELQQPEPTGLRVLDRYPVEQVAAFVQI